MSLKKLSQSLGLSQTTVSRALNGYPEVSAKTRIRVQRLAEEMNYRPSASARRLASGRSHTIAHVVPIGDRPLIDPHFSDVIAGANATYASAGYDMLLRVAPEDQVADVYRELASQKSVDGVLLLAPRLRDPRLRILNELGLPFVVHGRTGDPEDGYSWLDVDNRSAIRRATAHLLDLGHRRIALINGREVYTFAEHRRLGFDEALAGAGVEPRSDYRVDPAQTEPEAFWRTKALLALSTPPTAVVCGSKILGLGAARALRDAGLAPGVDLSLIAYDDRLAFLEDAQADAAEPPEWTAMRSSIHEAGRRVGEILLERIADPTAPHHRELWTPELVVGRSTAPPR